MPVLITAGLSPEAHRLRRVLNLSDVVFTDHNEIPSIPGIQTVIIPSHSSPSFIHEVLKACLDLAITRVYALRWGEILELSEARALFSEYAIELIIPSGEWLDDSRTELQGRKENISVLKNGDVVEGAQFPEAFGIENASGIFTWATTEQEIEYSLYVVDDAGI